MSDSSDIHPSGSGSDALPALQHLTQLQHQLTALRSLLPSTVTPLLSSTIKPSPEALYTQFAASAGFALTAVRSFRAAWEDEETGRVLRQVRASLAKSGREEAGVRWWESEMAVQGDREKHDAVDEVDRTQDQNSTGTDERVSMGMVESEAVDVVEAFKKRRPACTIEYQNLHAPIKICVRSRLQPLNFTVQAMENTGGFLEYNVAVLGNSKLLESVAKCLALRPCKTDLVYTLDCLAAYSDLGSRKCDKCKRLIDSSALVPTIRKKLAAKNQEGADKEWEALHEGCQG